MYICTNDVHDTLRLSKLELLSSETLAPWDFARRFWVEFLIIFWGFRMACRALAQDSPPMLPFGRRIRRINSVSEDRSDELAHEVMRHLLVEGILLKAWVQSYHAISDKGCCFNSHPAEGTWDVSAFLISACGLIPTCT